MFFQCAAKMVALHTESRREKLTVRVKKVSL